MIEVWLFGRLLTTLASAFAVVLMIVALTSVTYLAMTLVPALRLPVGGDRAIRRVGLTAAFGALAAALAGLRVGAPGSAGELIPTLAVSVAAAAAFGASASFLALGTARATLALGAAGDRQRREIEGRKQGQRLRLESATRAFLAGDDLHAELAEAEAAVGRLRAALTNLDATRVQIAERLARLDEAAAAGDLGRELRRAREEVATKLDLGGRILGAAETAAFRMACGEPLRRLLRQRPSDLAKGLGPDADAAATMARLGDAAAEIDAFLSRAADARRALAALEGRRPTSTPADDHDPWTLAARDLEAVETAYATVRERLEVVRLRLSARAEIDAVTAAAGEVSDKARASGLPAADLQGLVDEVMRAESAILMATPGEYDAQALAGTLTRGTAALRGHDGASLDELLRALRELS
jgi:hypothetical protein